MELEEMNHYVLECARYGEDEDLKTLFKAGADVNYQDDLTGNTGLHRAAANSEIKCLEVLLEHGALYLENKLGNTPCHWAAQNGQAVALKFLLDHYKEIDVLQKNKSGRSILTEAFQSQNQECIELCLSHSSATEERLLDPNSTTESADETNKVSHVEVSESDPTTDTFGKESGDGTQHQLLDETNAVTHRMVFGDRKNANIEQLVHINVRELPITRADNPFGTESAPEDDTTGLAVWTASILLAQWVVRLADSEPERWKGKVALELGAGCGLPGLVAAHCCTDGTVYITDVHKPTLKNAAFNARYNFPSDVSRRVIRSSNDNAEELMKEYEAKHCDDICCKDDKNEDVTVKVASMNWFDATSFPPEQVDLLLGSDLVYDHKILAALVPAVCALLSVEGTFYYVAPNTGRQGMDELKSALSAVDIICVNEAPVPDEFYANPFEEWEDDDQVVLHFYDLAAKQPHTLYTFKWKSAESLTVFTKAVADGIRTKV